MRTIYDITIPVRDGLAVWPGDTLYRFELGWKMSEGQSVNVGAVTMSCHTGTHADAPFHFLPDGDGIGELDLSPYLGPAIVADVQGHAVITTDDLYDLNFLDAPRLLLKTGGWTDHERFPETVPVIAADVPEFLAEQGVVLLGVDVPSVDDIESKDLPNHHALAAQGIHILESLDLRVVPPGLYELTALPLRLVGADGSPVRAILRSL
jgi:arylformamidase